MFTVPGIHRKHPRLRVCENYQNRFVLKRHYLNIGKLLIFATVVASLGALVASHQVRPYQLPSLASFECMVIDSTGERGVFHAYTPSNWRVEDYGRQLCDEVLPHSGFSQARISWVPREQLRTEDIIEKEYSLIWIRHDSLKGLMHDYESFYDVLLALPTYKVYWISRFDSPTLTQSFFNNKRIGLLGDSQSQSAYQQPIRHLHENNIKINDDQLLVYPTKLALINAFLDQKLDLISVVGIGDFTAINNWPEQNKILITDQADIGNWYVDNSITGPLRCQLLQSLSLYATMIEEAASISITLPPCT